MKRALLFAAVAAALVVSAAAPAPPAQWTAELRDADAAWATKRLAILKIDDAIYIKPGERAWLAPTKEGVAWALERRQNALVEAFYESGQIELKQGEAVTKFVAEKGGSLSVNDRIDVRAQLTQMAPDQMGVRLFAYNQDNPAPKAFKGLDYFQYNPAYAVEAAFEAEAPKGVDFETSRGWVKRFWRVGVAKFTLNGAEIRLPLYGETATPGVVSSFFTDATTGKSTYGVGRYLDMKVQGTFPPKTVTVDFNYAYNPNCARSTHYNCPYATDHLPVAVKAGEKAPPPH